MLLTKRTNVLLDETDHATLLMYSRLEGKTLGEVIRDSLKKTIKTKIRKKLSSDSNNIDKDLIKRIKAGWKLLINPEIPMDYRSLIEDGRKY